MFSFLLSSFNSGKVILIEFPSLLGFKPRSDCCIAFIIKFKVPFKVNDVVIMNEGKIGTIVEMKIVEKLGGHYNVSYSVAVSDRIFYHVFPEELKSVY